MARRVRMNYAEVGRLLRSGAVRDIVTQHAERALSAAKASAPVKTGDYRDSLHIEQTTTDRVVTRVVSDSDHAWIVEARFGVLARSLDAA